MAAEGKYDMAVLPTSALVRSASRGNLAHRVTFPSCDCEDFINSKGQLVKVDGIPAVTLCKHVAEGLQRIGGWNRQAPAAPEPAIYPNLTRDRALTLLTSAHCAAGLSQKLLTAACSMTPLAVSTPATTGEVTVKFDDASGTYEVTLPGAQPLDLPGNWDRQVHEGVSRERARTLLTAAGFSDPGARATLGAIRVHNGRETLYLRDGGVARVFYDDEASRYTVDLPA